MIIPNEVESIQPVVYRRVKPIHQPLLHSPPSDLAQIRVAPAHQPNPTTQDTIMADGAEQTIPSNEPSSTQ